MTQRYKLFLIILVLNNKCNFVLNYNEKETISIIGRFILHHLIINEG